MKYLEESSRLRLFPDSKDSFVDSDPKRGDAKLSVGDEEYMMAHWLLAQSNIAQVTILYDDWGKLKDDDPDKWEIYIDYLGRMGVESIGGLTLKETLQKAIQEVT